MFNHNFLEISSDASSFLLKLVWGKMERRTFIFLPTSNCIIKIINWSESFYNVHKYILGLINKVFFSGSKILSDELIRKALNKKKMASCRRWRHEILLTVNWIRMWEICQQLWPISWRSLQSLKWMALWYKNYAALLRKHGLYECFHKSLYEATRFQECLHNHCLNHVMSWKQSNQ